LNGIEIDYVAGQTVIFIKKTSIRFKNPTQNKQNENVTNTLVYIGPADIVIQKAQAEKEPEKGEVAKFEANASIIFSEETSVKFPVPTTVKIKEKVTLDTEIGYPVGSGSKIKFHEDTTLENKVTLPSISKGTAITCPKDSKIVFTDECKISYGTMALIEFEGETIPQPLESTSTFAAGDEIICKNELVIISENESIVAMKLIDVKEFKAGDVHLFIDDAIIEFVPNPDDDSAPKTAPVEIEYSKTFPPGVLVKFLPSEEVSFPKEGTEMTFENENPPPVIVKKPPPPEIVVENPETAIEDPTDSKQAVSGAKETYKPGTALEFEEEITIKYPNGAVLMNEKMETIIITPGEVVNHYPGQTLVVIKEVQVEYKSAGNVIVQKDALKQEIVSKNQKEGEETTYAKGSTMKMRDTAKVTFKKDTLVIVNGESILIKAGIVTTFRESQEIIFNETADIVFETPALITVNQQKLDVVKKDTIPKGSTQEFAKGQAIQLK
jgi:hypothetical protein